MFRIFLWENAALTDPVDNFDYFTVTGSNQLAFAGTVPFLDMAKQYYVTAQEESCTSGDQACRITLNDWRLAGSPPPAVVPEPATMVLMGTGLLGLFGVVYRRRRQDLGAEV